MRHTRSGEGRWGGRGKRNRSGSPFNLDVIGAVDEADHVRCVVGKLLGDLCDERPLCGHLECGRGIAARFGVLVCTTSMDTIMKCKSFSQHVVL